MVDSTVYVSNVTNPVIARIVPVIKAAHCSQYHSHTNLSSVCVDSLTGQITRDAHHASDPTNAGVPARDDIAKIPVFLGRLSIYRARLIPTTAPATPQRG